MKELILNNQLLTMSSRDLLDIVNQARLAHSEPPVRLNVFTTQTYIKAWVVEKFISEGIV